jgi:hypothetical protein
MPEDGASASECIQVCSQVFWACKTGYEIWFSFPTMKTTSMNFQN